MTQISHSLLCGLMAATFAIPVLADTELNTVKANLARQYPSTKFGAVDKTPIAGLYQVVMGKNVAYVEASGRYFLFGNLFDMQTQQDLTASVRAKANKVDFARLPKNQAIKIVMGNGKRVFALFSDPDCPYCRRFEQTLVNMTDYTMYVFPFPIASLHSDAPATSVSIWCAANQGQTWRDYLLQGKKPSHKQCANPIEKNVQLAESLGIRGTPSLIHQDGRMTSGALDKAALEQWLEGKK